MDAPGASGEGRPGGPNRSSTLSGSASGRRVVGGSATFLVLILAVATVGGSMVFGVATGATRTQGYVGPLGAPGPSCAYVNAVPPGAVKIAASSPSGSYPTGTTLSASVELRAVAISGLDATGSVELPSLSAVFTLAGGSTLTLVLAPRALNVSTVGWTDPSLATTTSGLTTATDFAPGGNTTLSSSLIAVMASDSFGALEVGVRWHWALQAPGGSEVSGAWTVPSATGGVPSLFFPQPYVTPLQAVPTSATIGANFTVELTGGAPGQTFPMKLENASTGATLNLGSAVSSPTPGASFSGSIAILGATGYLAPGHYLVHLHDACGSILYSWPVTASYASVASVAFAVAPGGCGPVSFDGQMYAYGASWSGTPGPTAHTATVPACSGYAFLGWKVGGGVSLVSMSGTTASVRVSASGSLTAEFA